MKATVAFRCAFARFCVCFDFFGGCEQEKSEFGLGSAIFGISDVDFLRMVRIKRDIEKYWNFDKKEWNSDEKC